ncbi:hypothetical protein [Paenarthrobacter nitroguajacolicus]|uniref:hypothetical protein n=1 Tax=Paenarthrobacter nitroguajacolicus TaxID=211146 RepID=UPI002864A997|nr:hypothetical protein [Paenarthrobacter nitroguajacolicus]MDR6637428.1 hypothetical protein [Paenarthrobacter nitroguajacolicus]
MTETLGTVRIVAGTPGEGTDAHGEESFYYPSSTPDIAKLFRERGLSVEFEHDQADRRYTSLHSAEFWLPVVCLSLQVLQSVGEGLLTSVIQDWIGRADSETSTLHVTYRISRPNGEEREFSATGPGGEVMEALDVFERKQLGLGEIEA